MSTTTRKYLDYEGLEYYAKNSKLIKVTYDQLKQLRDDSKLIPGQQYQIIDYKTTCTTSTYTDNKYRFDGRVADAVGYTYNYFDIIVTADSNNTLNENARACKPSSTNASTESKYTGQNFAAWKLKYTIDNDTQKYKWITSSGKGVIYYMEDEWGNIAYYDFKNIVMRPYMIDHTKLNNHNVANNYMDAESSQTIFTKTTNYLYTFGIIDKFESCTASLSVDTIKTSDGTLAGTTRRYEMCKNTSWKNIQYTNYISHHIPMNFMICPLQYHTSKNEAYSTSKSCVDTNIDRSVSCSIISLIQARSIDINNSENIDLYSQDIYNNHINQTRCISVITHNEYMQSGWIFLLNINSAGGYSTLCCDSHLKTFNMYGNTSRCIRTFVSSIQNNTFDNSGNILIDANADSEEPTTLKPGYILYNEFLGASYLKIKCGNVFSNIFHPGNYYATLISSNSNAFKTPYKNYFFYGANYGTDADNYKEISLPSGVTNTTVVGKNVQNIQIE